MPPARLKLTLETARTLAVIKQGLHQRPKIVDRQTLLNTVRCIGLLQLDSISVVARSHYLVMLSRVGVYDPAELDALLHPDRALFEAWAHAACLVPTEDYPYFAPVLAARRAQDAESYSLRQIGDNAEAVLQDVLNEIRERGPLASKDFDDPRPGRGTWWNHKPAKHALTHLNHLGHLMVDRRVNFQIYYDLAERVLPLSAESASQTIETYRRWSIQRSIGCLGVATANQASDYYRHKKAIARSILESLAVEEAVIPVEVEGWRSLAYIAADDLPLVDEIAQGQHNPRVTTFLTPFDNLTWNRERLRDLFNFDYQLEVYIPKAKRKYGYYVMPILHHGRYIGRLDPKVDRQSKTLILWGLYLDDGIAITDTLLTSLADAIQEFMAFHDCQQLKIKYTDPPVLKSQLLNQIKR